MAFVSTDLSKGSPEPVDPNFPRHVYHADGRWQPVKDEAAWLALGPGWGHPSDVARPALTHDPLSEPVQEVTRKIRKARA